MSQSETSAEAVQDLFARTSTPQLHFRTHDEIAGLLPGYALLDPGVVPTAAWRSDELVTEHEAARSNAYAAVRILR